MAQHWTDHLLPDEKFLAQRQPDIDNDYSTDVVLVLLRRLARSRAECNNLADAYIGKKSGGKSYAHIPLPPQTQAEIEENRRIAEEMRLMNECQQRGGCDWQPDTSESTMKFYRGFPAVRCTHCRSSMLFSPGI